MASLRSSLLIPSDAGLAAREKPKARELLFFKKVFGSRTENLSVASLRLHIPSLWRLRESMRNCSSICLSRNGESAISRCISSIFPRPKMILAQGPSDQRKLLSGAPQPVGRNGPLAAFPNSMRDGAAGNRAGCGSPSTICKSPIVTEKSGSQPPVPRRSMVNSHSSAGRSKSREKPDFMAFGNCGRCVATSTRCTSSRTESIPGPGA